MCIRDSFITLPAPLWACYITALYRWYRDCFLCRKLHFLKKIHKKNSQREVLFWLKYAPDRLSAGSPPQTPLGKLTVLPRYHSCIWGPTSKKRMVREEGKRLRGVRKGGKAKERKRRGRERKRVWPAHFSDASAAYEGGQLNCSVTKSDRNARDFRK